MIAKIFDPPVLFDLDSFFFVFFHAFGVMSRVCPYFSACIDNAMKRYAALAAIPCRSQNRSTAAACLSSAARCSGDLPIGCYLARRYRKRGTNHTLAKGGGNA